MKQRFAIDENRITIRGFFDGRCRLLADGGPLSRQVDGGNSGSWFLRDDRLSESVSTRKRLCPMSISARCCTGTTVQTGSITARAATIAYSGELDKQKQAADLMVAAAKEQGFAIPHLIGPDTAHKLHPESKQRISAELRVFAIKVDQSDQRTSTIPPTRYVIPIAIGCASHGRQALATGSHSRGSDRPKNGESDDPKHSPVHLTDGRIATGGCSQVIVDGQTVACPAGTQAVDINECRVDLVLSRLRCRTGALEKRPSLQGPIDDAFLSAFLFVPPQSTASPSKVDQWVNSELVHARPNGDATSVVRARKASR